MRRIRRIPKTIRKENSPNKFLHLNKIDKIYYINLEKRKDRKESIEKELNKIDPEGEKIERINAVEHKKGAIGCGKSHIIALKKAIENDYENVLIFEDDFIFENDILYLNECIEEVFSEQEDYDVFLLGRNIKIYKKISKNLVKVYSAATTSGYLINKKFFPKLLECFEYSVNMLTKGVSNSKAAIDVVWRKFQNDNYKFLTSVKKLGYQMPSYSNIEKRFTDYRC